MSVDPPVAGPQAETAVVHEPPGSTGPLRILDDAQRLLFRLVLNRIIPPHDELPGAGDLGAGASIERTLGESPRLRRLFLDGLTAIQVSTPGPFVDMDEATQTAHLQVIEQRYPAFFAALVDHAYRAYYTQPRVQQAIGWARPPQPLGHTLPPFDANLLAQQRARAPFWRRHA
jgi:gluconate 2-dehydrogenase subunit 3-like protein